MSAKTVFFFCSTIALLVTLSIVLNFWIYLLISFVTFVVIVCLIAPHIARKKEEERFFRSISYGEFRRSPIPRIGDRSERRLRDRIQTEWNRFDDEDLK